MSELFWLTDEQIERVRAFFPKSHGRARVDYRRVPSGIVFVNCNGVNRLEEEARIGKAGTLVDQHSRLGVVVLEKAAPIHSRGPAGSSCSTPSASFTSAPQ